MWKKYNVSQRPANGTRLPIIVNGIPYVAVFTWHCGDGARWDMGLSYFKDVDPYCDLPEAATGKGE